ncbi:MAG: acyl-CoA dehydrogenase family protein [Xanthobacteraceae bacterium]|nr:acyl-CoA dehydrogenase family protein [Xanthobacteraceae bacterium]
MTRASSSTAKSRPHDGVAADDYIARARALAPAIAAAAPQIEAGRELTPEVVAALHEAGLFRMLLPRSLGGGELAPDAFVRAVEAIAAADASTAWCVAQTSICSTLAASLRPDVAQKLFADRSLLAWGPFSPKAKAVACAGGYRVSGAWAFASGSRHAAWLAAHCPVIEADGRPRTNADGVPVEITAIFPKASATITDNWHVVGLKGTGSDSYSVGDLFVPDAMTMNAYGRDSEGKYEHGPLYRFTVFQLFAASFGGIALGIARSALDSFTELAKSKVPTGGKALLRDNAVIQSQIGMAETQLASARVFLIEALRAMHAEAAQSGTPGVEARVMLRMASSNATYQARSVVDTAYHAAGASAIFESNPFERRFRDIHTVSQQVQAHFSLFESIGQHFLGLPLHPKFI